MCRVELASAYDLNPHCRQALLTRQKASHGIRTASLIGYESGPSYSSSKKHLMENGKALRSIDIRTSFKEE
jgi:hypothetical protein